MTEILCSRERSEYLRSAFRYTGGEPSSRIRKWSCRMRSAITGTKISPTGQEFRVRSHQKVLLGPLCLEICSNEQDFRGMRYFPQSTQADENTVSHYTVNLCNINLDGP